MGNDHAKERRKSSDASGFELDPKAMRHLSAKAARHHNDDFLDMPLRGRAGSTQNEGHGGRHAVSHRPRATTEVSRSKAGRFAGFLEKRAGNREKVSSGESPNSKEGKVQGGTGQKRLPTIFKYNGKADEVYLCGSFNNWQRLPMSRSTKDFVAIVDLAVGEHQYKFLANGKWEHDANLATVDCNEGGKNNLIRVQKEDFNAYDALAMDSRSVNLSKKNSLQTQQAFGQNIPPTACQMFDANGPGRLSGPPILPPQLLQVILNQDTSLSCEPTLLPEPNHVMINHLYALSIKDGVMVLSSTNRFRKKYVTTLLYKPMGARIPD